MITAATQRRYNAGFIWEAYKQPMDADEVDATAVLNTICKAIDPFNSRCGGHIPAYGSPDNKSFLE